MAIQQIESLEAGASRLEFRHEHGLWCWLVLEYEGADHFLGGDEILVILRRLLAFFEGTSGQPGAGHGDGLVWQWILTTGMPHHSLFGAKDGDETILKFWDADAGREITRVRLTAAETAHWIERLNTWRFDAERFGDNAFV
jgi:hypothetical protein